MSWNKTLLSPPSPTARLIFLCTALWAAPAELAASAEIPLEVVSQPVDAASAVHLSIPAVAPPVVGEVSSGPPIVPQSLEENGEARVRSLPNASDKQSYPVSELCRTVALVATANNLPIRFFANLIHQESGFKPHVVSPAGAQGIAQFMPQVAASYGLANPFDPIAALTASGKLLAELVGQFGNLGLAAAAYNAGPKRVQDWMAKRRGLPLETRHYVQSITGRAADTWATQGEIMKAPELVLPLHGRCIDPIVTDAQASDAIKTAAQTGKSSSPQPALSRTVVRHSMPQPSQFAMGLPVSRFAAMATPLVAKDTPDRKRRRQAHARNDHLDKAMKQFAAMPTPVIMIEEKSASAQPTERGQSKTAYKRFEAHLSHVVKAHQILIVAAR